MLLLHREKLAKGPVRSGMRVFCVLAVLTCLSCVVNGELNFLVVADWGGDGTWPYYTFAQQHNAEQMGKTAEEIGSQFTVALGDNFYPLGVTDVDDSRFKATFEVSVDYIVA